MMSLQNVSRQGKGQCNENHPQLDDSSHKTIRDSLRIIGPIVLAVGLISIVIGVVSFINFFSSGSSGFDSEFGPLRPFLCVAFGMFVTVVGALICQFGFMGAFYRYFAGEAAPVGKDVINYMADGTQDAVRTIATAVGKGIHAGIQGDEPAAHAAVIFCQKCDMANEATASFCKSCGTPLKKTTRCSVCGESNDADARFCDHCGKELM
jgi:hypothetical protein